MKAQLQGSSTAPSSAEGKPRGAHQHAADEHGFQAVLLKAGASKAGDARTPAGDASARPDRESASRLAGADLSSQPLTVGLGRIDPDAAAEAEDADGSPAREDAPAGREGPREVATAPAFAAAGMLASLLVHVPASAPGGMPSSGRTGAPEAGKGEGEGGVEPPARSKLAVPAPAPLTTPDAPPAEPLPRSPTAAAQPGATTPRGRQTAEPPVASAEIRSVPAPAATQPAAAIASFASGIADALAALPAESAAPASPKIELRSATVPMQSLKIQLHPAELGVVTARLRLVGDGLEVHIQVETAKAYRELSDDTDGITRALQAIGLRVESVTVQAPAPSQSPDRAGTGQQGGGNGFAQPDGAGRDGRPPPQGKDNRPGGFLEDSPLHGRDRTAGEGVSPGGGLYI